MGDTWFLWVDAAGAEQGAGGCRAVTRKLAPRLSPGSCGSLAGFAARAKQVDDLGFPCKPLTQWRARAEDARPARKRRRPHHSGFAGGPAPNSSLGLRSTSAWAPASHALPEALP